jgi:DnaJ-domain-containing protein 1
MTPLRWLLDGVKAILFLLIVAGVCIIGSVQHFLQGGAFDSFQFAIGCWILGFLVMLFGAPLYTLFWGAAIYCSLFWWNINESESSSSLFSTVLWLYEGFGLLLVTTRIRHWANRRKQARERSVKAKTDSSPEPPPKSEPRNDARAPHSQRVRNAAPTSHKKRAASRTSDDYIYADVESLIAAARKSNCKECEDAYRVLGVENGADATSVKEAYRDLVKVWHPDRFADDDTRLKKKAEEQFEKVHAAYSHLREHQPPSSSDFDIEKMPLQLAVICTTAEFIAINGKALLLCARIAKAGVADRDDVCLAVGEDLAMLQSAINRLQRLIRRFEHELPSFLRTELESSLATFMQQRARVIDAAVSAGFIQAR